MWVVKRCSRWERGRSGAESLPELVSSRRAKHPERARACIRRPQEQPQARPGARPWAKNSYGRAEFIPLGVGIYFTNGGTGTIDGNTVWAYQKGGIVANGPATTATMSWMLAPSTITDVPSLTTPK